MARTAPRGREPVGIGRRARVIRSHRGLSLDTVAALAGLSEHDLSALERGERPFDRRGLVEDLANALGCPVAVLTGQPYLPVDRATADALAVLPGIREAIYGFVPDDPPDLPARPTAELAQWAQRALNHLDQDRYARAGEDLGTLLTELQVHAAADSAATRDPALAGLVRAAHVAAAIAGMLGYHDLALSAARRGLDAARRLGDPVSLGLARYGWARRWIDVAARPQAEAANQLALAELGAATDSPATVTSDATGAAELLGVHHLLAAKLAARASRVDAARDHLSRAGALAERTGERRTETLYFGPTAVALWTLSVETDLGDGLAAVDRPRDVEGLHSRAATGRYHVDLARALAQCGGHRDEEAIRHLDLADHAAPVRTRNAPIVRELTDELTRRAHRHLRQVAGLMDRFGLAGQRSQRVNN